MQHRCYTYSTFRAYPSFCIIIIGSYDPTCSILWKQATNLADLESTLTGCLREESQAFNGGAQSLLIYLMLIYFKLL